MITSFKMIFATVVCILGTSAHPNLPMEYMEDNMQLVRCTCYLPTGNRTADGTWPYEGILASNYEHMGQTALLYSVDGEFIGVFESRDVGGHPMLVNGTAIDIYRDNMDRAWAWVGQWGDHVYVKWIDAEG